jgi:hypothetical protein
MTRKLRMYIFLVLLCKNPELMSLSVVTYPVYLVEGLVIFATVTTFWTCGVSRGVTVMTIPPNFSLESSVAHFASVATVFGESMPFHFVCGPKPQTAIETAIGAVAD